MLDAMFYAMRCYVESFNAKECIAQSLKSNEDRLDQNPRKH